jgi:hypothetical protein
MTGALRGFLYRRNIRIGGKRWEIHWVSDVPSAASHLPSYGFRGVRGQVLGLVDIPYRRILIKEGMSDEEEQATIFHELIHVAAPQLSEYYVARIERQLYPILRRSGLRFSVPEKRKAPTQEDQS